MTAHTITHTAADYFTPCATWTRGPLTGSIPHIPLPFSRLAGQTEVGCHRCDKYLYTYRETNWQAA